MKKLLSIVTVFTLIISLFTACTSDGEKESANADEGNAKIKVVTTIYPQYDFAKKILGDRGDVKMLLKPGAEAHSYEPSPKDIEAIKSADLFICIGSHNEYWVDKIMDSMEGEKPEVIKLMDCVNLLDFELVEGMEHKHDHEHEHEGEDHEHEHEGEHHEAHEEEHHHDEDEHHEGHEEEHHDEDEHHEGHEEEHHDEEEHHEDHEEEHHHDEDGHHEGHEEEHHDEDKHHDSHEHEGEDHEHEHEGHTVDEHVWTSPKNAIKIARIIEEKVIEKDKEYEAEYHKNADAFVNELEGLDKELTEVVSNAKRRTVLFGDRFPFRYLANDYGLKYYAAFTGCSTETEADLSTIVFLEDKVKEEKLPVVFTIEMANGKIADAICEDTGAKKLVLHSCHNLTKDEVESGEDYLSIMKKNIENLKEALN